MEILNLLLFAPLLVIFLLANRAEQARSADGSGQTWAVLAYLLLAFLWLGLLSGGLLLQVTATALLNNPQAREDFLINLEAGGLTNAELFVSRLPLLGLSVWLPALGGLLLLWRPVRRWVARIVPVDPTNVVHAVALACVMLVLINLGFTLALGLDTLADILTLAPAEQRGAGPLSLWTQTVAFIALAFVGVGWPLRRSLAATLERLGLVRLNLSQVLFGTGLALVLVVALIPLDLLSRTMGFGFDEDVRRLNELLMGPLMASIPGILTLGLSAALGEETLLRGALQPRFGLFWTAVIFALLHSNYGLSLSTAVVFVLGLILGWVRQRHNTSTAIVLHAVYNMTLGLFGFLNLWPE
ncbi:MAG: CPBP family intramembrane metalloprotease [Caldilineales bacterium]|nr:CPBP family intramembrane metalloprotease [Caldilineales bacterium]